MPFTESIYRACRDAWLTQKLTPPPDVFDVKARALSHSSGAFSMCKKLKPAGRAGCRENFLNRAFPYAFD